MLFIAKGNVALAQKQTNEAGEITKETPATFSTDENGCCVAVGEFDEDAPELKLSIHSIHGDWDAAGYLGAILEALKPRRQINIPDFKAIFEAARNNGFDLCDYCPNEIYYCRDCIVKRWEEAEETEREAAESYGRRINNERKTST